MYDKLSSLQDNTTQTATFSGEGYDLGPGGHPNERLAVRVLYSAASNTSGSNTVVFSVEHSDDNSTFYALSSGAADTVALSSTPKSGELFIPVSTRKRYIRLVATISGEGTTPSVTYSGDIGTSIP